MLPRLLSGVFLAVFVSLLIFYIPALFLKIIVSILAAIGAYEAAKMTLPHSSLASKLFAFFLSGGLSLGVMMISQKASFVVLSLPFILMGTFIFCLVIKIPIEKAVGQISGTVFSIFYTGMLFAFMGLLRDLPNGVSWLYATLAATFSADTGAFFAGTFLGRHKLAPQVSPGKTLEGLFGGVLMSVFAIYVCRWLFFPHFTHQECWVIGTAVGFLGPIGDLSESFLKRSAGVKDSGNLIPGHGGLLDRMDAVLFTTPVVYAYLVFFKF